MICHVVSESNDACYLRFGLGIVGNSSPSKFNMFVFVMMLTDYCPSVVFR